MADMMTGEDDAATGSEAETSWFRFYLLPDGAAVEACVSLESLAQRLEAGATGGLLLYEEPVGAVATALEAGAALPEALARWRAEAEACLAVEKQFRRRLPVAVAALASEARLLLAERYPDLELPPASVATVSDPVAQALAALAFHHDAAAGKLLDQLQAATLGPFDELASPAELLGVAQQAWQSQAGALAAAQEARENFGSGLAEALAEQVIGLENALRRSEARRGEVIWEKQLVDRNYRARVHELSARLEAAYRSTSWRITAPVRSLARRIRG